jgi:hypothetical protein
MPMHPCVKPINLAQFIVYSLFVVSCLLSCSYAMPYCCPWPWFRATVDLPPADLPPVTERGGSRRNPGATRSGDHHPAGADTTSPTRPRDQALGRRRRPATARLPAGDRPVTTAIRSSGACNNQEPLAALITPRQR